MLRGLKGEMGTDIVATTASYLDVNQFNLNLKIFRK